MCFSCNFGLVVQESHAQQPVAEFFVNYVRASTHVPYFCCYFFYHHEKINCDFLCVIFRKFKHQNAHQHYLPRKRTPKWTITKGRSEFDCFFATCLLHRFLFAGWLFGICSFDRLIWELINLYFLFIPGAVCWTGLSEHSFFLSIHVFVCVTRSRHNSLYMNIQQQPEPTNFECFVWLRFTFSLDRPFRAFCFLDILFIRGVVHLIMRKA